jgi:flagellar biosynthesis protein FlhB
VSEEGPDKDARTEPATAEKLRNARQEGQLPIGHDAALVAGVLAIAAGLAFLAPRLAGQLTGLFAESATGLPRTPFGSLPGHAAAPALLVLLVCLAGALASAIATLAQTGGGFWSHLPLPDLSRLGGLGKFGRMLSKDLLVDLGVQTLKVTVIGWAVWAAVRSEFYALPRLLDATPGAQLAAAMQLLLAAAKPALAAAVVLAAGEWALSRWRFAEKMKMSKEEVRQEMKADEGDPQYKGQRKRRHRELMKNVARVEVPRADALLVNPTHIAIALRYRKDEGRAPRVTAKGKGALAEYMRDLARENGIPIVEDVPLARLLYRKVKVGREVPHQTYKAVATILAFVYRAAGRGPGGRAA